METEFYEPSFSSGREALKKHLSLDLNSPRLKKARFDVLLTSPDLNMLKIPSPELDRLILQQGGLLSAQQNSNPFSFPNPRVLTQTDLTYTRGLSETLLDLSDSTPQLHVSQSEELSSLGANSNFNQSERPPSFGANSNFSQDFPVDVKEESMTNFGSSSDSPLVSPIDLDSQERIKIERKRQRNRIAASKCRKRKLERIAKLEDRVKHLKTENVELAAVIHKLRQQVCGLKEQVLDHVNSGCHIVIDPVY